jgi:hypothetical protein
MHGFDTGIVTLEDRGTEATKKLQYSLFFSYSAFLLSSFFFLFSASVASCAASNTPALPFGGRLQGSGVEASR